MCEEHRAFTVKSADINNLLSSLEEKFSVLQQETDIDISEKVKKLQNISAERDKVSSQIADYVSSGESLLPDTATAGREIVRKELKETRER